MGFPAQWIDLISRCIKDCWFSDLINGALSGFFHSTRGLRQGDPLSPSLFVLAADYLSRSLERLMLSDRNMRFLTRKYGFPISHLSYADDIIIFSQAHQASVDRLITCLDHYEAVSGQKINHSKSNFFIHPKFATEWQHSIEILSGFRHGTLPFIYLGVTIYRGFVKASLFLDIR